MTNIREDKGYTYGIGSGISSHLMGGQFVISTEVGVDVTQNALKEIYHEVEILQNELTSEEELELVKNYMLGNFLRSMDGPFSLSERLSSLLDYDLKPEYLNQVIDAIRATTPAKIQELAAKYLNKEDLTQLVVGKLI
jgi:predicted Zn-dependent peptidase